MKKVYFSNPGIIDPAMWNTFGVSVKATEGAIGQFGTGLKYAIAVLLRNRRSIEIRSGGQTYTFTTESRDLRGKEFSICQCNGKDLPFTTHLGGHWELWMAYRELFSNCLDEGGHLGSGGDTEIIAELGDIDHDRVFLNPQGRKVVQETPHATVYAGGSTAVYYRGILTKELDTPSLFTYDIKLAELTEDRTFLRAYHPDALIANALLSLEDMDYARAALFDTEDLYEDAISFLHRTVQPSPAVLEVVKQNRRRQGFMLDGMFRTAISVLGKAPVEVTTATERETIIIGKAVAFLIRLGHEVDRYPIHVSKTLGDAVLAIAEMPERRIVLSTRVLTQGVKQVASTLLEEYVHLAYGLHDCSYAMQTFLFDQVITMGEIAVGEYL